MIKEFDGEHVSEFDNIDLLNETYDRCLISFATHITSKRDVSYYTEIVSKLKIPIYAFSLGIQDYVAGSLDVMTLHPSMKRLLEIVSDSSAYLGVRGEYTASILYRSGFKNVLPIGCPTLYWNLEPKIEISKKSTDRVGVVYHRALSEIGWDIIKHHTIIGQDFLDEAIFCNRIEDTNLYNMESKKYQAYDSNGAILNKLQNDAIFPSDFQSWFSLVGKQDFVFGARLHGCVAALIQGIPAVMVSRDLRVKEIANFYNIPHYTFDQIKNKKFEEIYAEANFEAFETTYQFRYKNFLAFLDLNGLSSNLYRPDKKIEFNYSIDDTLTRNQIIFHALQDIQSNYLAGKESKSKIGRKKMLIQGMSQIKRALFGQE